MTALAVAAAVAVTLSAALAVSVLARLRRLRRELQSLRHFAHHDSLTGLYNRAGLAALWPSVWTQRPAVVLMDLNKFKPVNDTFGHAAGDVVLATVAARLRAFAPLGATLVRLGGDEFVIVAPSAGLPTLLGDVIAAVAGPIVLSGGQEVQVSGSFGVTFADCGHLETALADADSAMYRAKSSGVAMSTYTRDRGDGTCPGCAALVDRASRVTVRLREMPPLDVAAIRTER